MTDPADEFFPFQLPLANQGGIQAFGPVLQLDLSGLCTALSPHLSDPDSAFTSSEVIPRPKAAPQTRGPHRYSIYVPHDDGAAINVGASRAPWSPGIGMATKSTITLNAYQGSPTCLNLGLPALAIGPIASSNAGYCLYTEGSSNHNAKMQVTVTSQTEGIGLTAKKAVVLHSNEADVSLEAKESVALKGKKITLNATSGEVINAAWYEVAAAAVLTAVDAADFAAPIAGHKGGDVEAKVGAGGAGVNFVAGLVPGNAAKLKDQWIAAASGHVSYVLTHVATLAGLALSFKKTWKEPKKGSSAWEIKSAKFQYVLSVVGELKALYSDFPKAADPADPGSISIEAESTIGMTAKGGITINGAGGVGITGFKGVSIGGLTTSMKGHKEATIFGGLGASMKSLAGDVAMSSDLKGATVKGKKDVEMSSEAGKATVSGDLDAQLNSMKAKVFVHGKTAAYVGAGAGAGMGLCAKPDTLTLGKVANADNFGSAAPDGAYTVIRMLNSTIQAKVASDSELVMTKSMIKLKTPKVDLAASGKVVIKGSTVEIC